MIINRSRYVVSVVKRPELTEMYPYDQPDKAREARERLQRENPKAKVRVTQNEDSILVRIRARGHPELNATFDSYEAADLFEQKVKLERRQGVFVDYAKCMHTTTADLIRMYMKTELPKQKGGDNYAYFFQSVLDDSERKLERQIQQREREIATTGSSEIKIKAMRSPMGCLEWVNKPLTEVTGKEIEDWMESRRGDVVTSTIWRQYEHIRAMFGVAMTTWGYHLRVKPTDGVRKRNWAYDNERDRRLEGDEFDRMMNAARAYDARKSLERRVQELIAENLADEIFTSASHRKRRLLAARAEVTQLAEQTYVHRPVMEAFILFQLATGARRAEALDATWPQVKFDKKTVFLPETKNNHARNLALRKDVSDLLQELPREGETLFGLTVSTCTSAWEAIMEEAGIKETDELPKLLIHDLRHEAISAVAETGVSLLELQAFSGHRDIRMLQRYVHLSMTHLAEKLSAAVESGKLKNGRKRWDPKVLKIADVLAESMKAHGTPAQPESIAKPGDPKSRPPVAPEHAADMRDLERALAPVFDLE